MLSKITKEEFLLMLKDLDFSNVSEELKDYKKNILSIDETLLPRDLFLYFPQKQKIEKAKKQFISIYKSMQKLANFMIFKKPELLHFIHKEGIDIEAMKKRNSQTFLGYSRIDTLYGSGDFRLVEFNSRRPQMYEDADYYSQYFSQIIGKENIIAETNANNLMNSIEDQFQVNTKKDFPESIIVISNFANQKYSFSTANIIKEKFNKSKIIFLNRNELENFYEKSIYENGKLVFEGNKIDLIFMQNTCGSKGIFARNGKIKRQKIAQAFHENNLEIYTSPTGQISGTKLSLDLLQDPEIQNALELTDEEKESIKIIPHSVHSQNIKNIEDFEKDKYVIKLTNIGQGQGVILGSSMTQLEWGNFFIEKKEKKIDFLVQERINLFEEEIWDLQEKRFRKAFITLEPFVMNNPKNNEEPFITGFSARAIPIENYSENLKFNPAKGKKEIMFGAVVEFK